MKERKKERKSNRFVISSSDEKMRKTINKTTMKKENIIELNICKKRQR